MNLGLIIWLIFLAGCASLPKEEKTKIGLYEGKIIDAHAHYSAKKIHIDEIMSILDRTQVSQIVLFAGEKDLQAAVEKYPTRIIPFLSPYGIYRENREMKIPGSALVSIQASLGSGFFKGYGEVLLRLHPLKGIAPNGVNVPVDDPVMLKLYDIAADYKLPVNVHVDAHYSKELEKALHYNRKAIIIWAHCGYADPALIRSMFAKHPNLFGDLSVLADPYKKHALTLTDSKGFLKPEWKKLFEDFSDRLMLGSDMGKEKSRFMITPKIIRHYRKMLFQVSPEAANNIGHKTVSRILQLLET